MKRIVIVTGMSGAGKSTALNVFEDLNFEVIDNLPLSLLPEVAAGAKEDTPLAVGIDARTRDFDCTRLNEIVTEIQADADISEKIVFLDCDDEKLLLRFTETRRSHPLAKNKKISDGIAEERRMTARLKESADTVIDTTEMKVADLRLKIESLCQGKTKKGLIVSVISFSYREGLPRESDLVFDVRFLRNPHYDLNLRALTGQNAAVGAYIAEDPEFKPFFDRLTGFIKPLLPRFVKEGKTHLTIAVGCTGGKHRSVYTAEQLYKWLLTEKGCIVNLTHRELEKQKTEKNA